MAAPPGKAAGHAAGLLAVASVPAGLALVRGFGLTGAADVVNAVGAIVAIAAAAGSLICWRILGLARYGWWGSALGALGLLTLANDSFPILGSGALTPALPVGRVVVFAVAGALVAAALRAPEVDAGLLAFRVAGGAAALGLVLLDALGLAARQRLLPAGLMAPPGQAVAEAVMAVAWAGLALVAWRRTARPVRWATPVLALEGAAAALAGVGVLSSPWVLALGAVTGLFGLCIACVECSADLSAVLRSQDRRSLRLRLDLDAARGEMIAERHDLDERLHDLRNALSAVRAADLTLRRYHGRLEPDASASLADAISSELARLQVLIEPAPRPAVDFAVAEALQAVVTTERTLGARIDAELGHLRAHGDPDALAQIVQNLLANARRHAAGTAVRVAACARGDRVEIRVRDGGPGIPTAERQAIFERGVQGAAGSDAGGSGLGLHVARRLAASMGGHLRLDGDGPAGGGGGEPGACFVVDIPAAEVIDLAEGGRVERLRHLRSVS